MRKDEKIREAARALLALLSREADENKGVRYHDHEETCQFCDAYIDLRAALALPEDDPVAWAVADSCGYRTVSFTHPRADVLASDEEVVPLYARPTVSESPSTSGPRAEASHEARGVARTHAPSGQPGTDNPARPAPSAESVREADCKDLIRAVRSADARHQTTGGGANHYVKECLLPALDAEGLRVIRSLPLPPASKAEANNKGGSDE